MAHKPLLITAFKPWGDHKDNITRRILEDLQPDLQRRGIDIAVLDVLYSAVDGFIAALDGRDYFNIISLGIMPQSAPPIRFETRARKTAFKPDDSGARPVFNGAAAADEYKADPALLALRDHENLHGYDIGVSDNAGAYLCEYLSYRTQQTIAAKGTGGGAIFIHMSNDDFAQKRQFLLDYLGVLDMAGFSNVPECSRA